MKLLTPEQIRTLVKIGMWTDEDIVRAEYTIVPKMEAPRMDFTFYGTPGSHHRIETSIPILSYYATSKYVLPIVSSGDLEKWLGDFTYPFPRNYITLSFLDIFEGAEDIGESVLRYGILIDVNKEGYIEIRTGGGVLREVAESEGFPNLTYLANHNPKSDYSRLHYEASAIILLGEIICPSVVNLMKEHFFKRFGYKFDKAKCGLKLRDDVKFRKGWSRK